MTSSTNHLAPGAIAGEAEGAHRSADEIRAWLVDRLSRELQIEPAGIDVHRPVFVYGVDSILALGLSDDIGRWLGRKVDPALLWDHPTIDAIALHLAAESPR
jgi:acyl carrier protein